MRVFTEGKALRGFPIVAWYQIGYDKREVDVFMERVRQWLDGEEGAQRVSVADVLTVLFSTRFRGYERGAVDRKIDRLVKEVYEREIDVASRDDTDAGEARTETALDQVASEFGTAGAVDEILRAMTENKE